MIEIKEYIFTNDDDRDMLLDSLEKCAILDYIIHEET